MTRRLPGAEYAFVQTNGTGRSVRRDRKMLLLGTALASTLLLEALIAPSPAHAVDCLVGAPPPPGRISLNAGADEITCVNTSDRNNLAPAAANVINLVSDSFITLNNSGGLTGTFAGAIRGIRAISGAALSITNSGEIVVTNTGAGGTSTGIRADSDTTLSLTNSGAITATSTSGGARAINAESSGSQSITNSGTLTATAFNVAFGIQAETSDVNSKIEITNEGAITATSNDDDVYGIYAETDGENSSITVINRGDITVSSSANGKKSGGDVYGIYAQSEDENSPVTVKNYGNIQGTNSGDIIGIYANSEDVRSPIVVLNQGDITVSATGSGKKGGGDAYGIYAYSDEERSTVTVTNSGDISATSNEGDAYGIYAGSEEANSPVEVTNSGDIIATASGEDNDASGIGTDVDEDSSPVTIKNSGNIRAIGKNGAYGYGIWAETEGVDSPVLIDNSGSVYSTYIALWSYSYEKNTTTIVNTGDVSAKDHFAIYVGGYGNAKIYNAGTITGYVKLTEQNDRFFNEAGGVFETKKTSLFGGGEDVFINRFGATVQAGTNGAKSERSSFEGLETFRNSGGTISLIDGGVGDRFTLTNNPGEKDLKFEGGGFLGVDANLRGPGSSADLLRIDGNVSGQTQVIVANTSTQPGVFNGEGIKIVEVAGKTPSPQNFVLADGPIDTGLFDYDLFFTPTGSGFWSLKSFPGASAQLLPQLLTAAQDIWHETSSTWFDRTADLRVVLNGGTAPAYEEGTKSLGEPTANGLTPGAWLKVGGSYLERDSSATSSAFGRSYTFNLDNELQTIDLQGGIDMGERDVITGGDALLFGVLGGFVGGNLDYDSLNDRFSFSGGQIGAYATYLSGGLFIDALLNAHIYEIDADNLGFPDSLNATTLGLRTDAGYRFGSFTGGAFFEPLGTIEVIFADIDGFNVAGNRVSFSDDANVRGRIGARAGTTTEVWSGTMMEPFVTASLWGNLSDDNTARLVSSGTTFRFEDDPEDVWGEISGGVNFFNFSKTTSVFAKLDYTFGDDIQGLGGKAGMRVAW